jgi:glycerol dehydrogenase
MVMGGRFSSSLMLLIIICIGGLIMKKVMIGPRKYVQGAGVLEEAGHYIGLLGKKPLILWGKRTKAAIEGVFIPSLKQAGLEPVEVIFCGECTKEEAARVAGIAQENNADVIVGIGGGKAIDNAKGAADKLGMPMVSIPTIASNDAPTSGLSVWYKANGDYLNFEMWKFNPDIVLVDTAVIAKSPVRAFVSGVGDALSTWLEADASFKSRALTCSGGLPAISVMAIARACYDTLFEFAMEAKRSVELQIVTPALEKCVEANVLMSGIGFESGGLASSHSIANALPFFPETHHFLHGEKVAFGIVTQLCLEEDIPAQEIYRVVDFLIDMGLPVTFNDLNMVDISRERIMAFGEVAAEPGAIAHNHIFKVTPQSIAEAMIAADALGKARKQLKGIK